MLVPVLEWNLAIGLQSERHARRQMRAIAALNPTPRILVLVEARRTLQEVYASELTSRTRHEWRGVSHGHCARNSWNATAGSCERQDDECVMVLSSFSITASDDVLLPCADSWHSARAAVHAAVDVGGTTIHVVGTHLQAGFDGSIGGARLQSIGMLKAWTTAFESPIIVGGDFNELPQSEAISGTTLGMASAFRDTWELCGSGASATFPAWWATRKIDYWFADPSGKARPTSTMVARTVRLSDHYPLLATFEISSSPDVRTSGRPDVQAD